MLVIPYSRQVPDEAFGCSQFGTGVISDTAAGKHITDTIYDDANPDQIETIAPTQMHRNVDLELLEADKEGTCSDFRPSTYSTLKAGRRLYQDIYHPTVYNLLHRQRGASRCRNLKRSFSSSPCPHQSLPRS